MLPIAGQTAGSNGLNFLGPVRGGHFKPKKIEIFFQIFSAYSIDLNTND